MRQYTEFRGLDGSSIKIRLQSGGHFNKNIKNQECVNINCRRSAYCVFISNNGIANLTYCKSCASNHLAFSIFREEKLRGKWFEVWKGKLNEMYSQKYIVYPFLKRMKNTSKQYAKLGKYYRPMTKKQISNLQLKGDAND